MHYNGHLSLSFVDKKKMCKFKLLKNILVYRIFLESVSINFDSELEEEVLSNGIINEFHMFLCWIMADFCISSNSLILFFF